MCCQRARRQQTEIQPERKAEKGKVLELTTKRIQEANTASLFQDSPAHTIRMGCTTGHLTCQTQAQTSSGQEAQSLEAGGAKVPDVLSSLERLSQATGGMEKSWYRCIFPFGIISLVIGVAGTGVTYTYNDLPQTKVVSVVLLVMGLLLLLMATACWTVHKKKRRKKKEGGSFTSEQCPL
ncbi:transmembrane protein 100 [Labrus bergylta]|uniref:transmembrane protein 100 n=1 Tax=Labrus bergylta TaxID=56723 RepID=UPI0033135D61